MTPLHNLTMDRYIQNEFHIVISFGYIVRLRTGKNIEILAITHEKGNSFAFTDDTLIKFHVHNLTTVIYIKYKFYEIPSIGCLVMAGDGK